VSWLGEVGASLYEGALMLWETFWALVLGFALSGAVQAFVSRGEMRRALGDHTPRTLARSSFLGMVSSSCSYAASALAKSLFARGADFTSAMVFMFASTNLVLELGIVLWLLIGWQFALAELVGGVIMIALLGLVVPRVFPAAWVEQARARLETDQASANSGSAAGSGGADAAITRRPWRERIASRAGWSDAAGYTISDLTMLRTELVAGFVIAGFAAVMVPTRVWQSLFITGHGFWSSLENVVLGPFLALISFVCSIGNVPLAAALWRGGISFGGVVSFIFADLITLPLVLIYRRYYGTRFALRLLAVFWVVMSVAGLATEGVFALLGLVPAATRGPAAMGGFQLDYTAVLNALALLGFGVLYWLYRNRERFGGGAAYAKDVICGMQVEKATAPASALRDGQTYWFCSDRCHDRFVAGAPAAVETPAAQSATVVDPVCGMTVDPASAPNAGYAGRTYSFCSTGCRDAFRAEPLAHLSTAPDPVCGMDVDVASPAARAERDGVPYVFCSSGCAESFRAAPAGATAEPTHR